MIDKEKMKKESVKIKKGCKYRSISNVTNIDTGNISFVAGKIYLAPEDGTLVSEEYGWLCDVSEDSSNFELVEEPASEDLEDFAKEYSFNIPSDVFHDLPEEKQALWKREIENAIVVGAEWQNVNDSQKFIHEESATFTRDQFNAEIKIAKEEIINRACEWLKENAANYVYWMDEEFGGEDLIDDFKKYMEDEK